MSMLKAKRDCDNGRIFTMRDGSKAKIIEVIGYNKRSNVEIVIEFLNINILGGHTKRIARYHTLCYGGYKDYYRPVVCGVACRGYPKKPDKNDSINIYSKTMHLWNNIISRCYNINSDNYDRYGGKGVTVCERWLCFEFFLEDIVSLRNYEMWLKDSSIYCLDKDCRVPGNKVYSPETCMFLYIGHNTIEPTARNNKVYIGVNEKQNINKKTYACVINGIYLGTYDCAEAAASRFNGGGRYLGYPPQYLNDIKGGEMNLDQIRSHCISEPVEINGKKLLYRAIPISKMLAKHQQINQELNGVYIYPPKLLYQLTDNQNQDLIPISELPFRKLLQLSE